MMLQQEKPEDFVIATGETHSVKEFLQLACKAAGIKDWEKIYKHNPIYDRPAEVDMLRGDASKAREKLGWKPSVNFEGLVKLMVEAELVYERENNGQ